ncbi:uncharacterized protein LOC129572144 [Sitodiplosis mosellana]|uniref:uncharacterized protein LOC129572144 n=1 Tax=Sitodiplosis mosellana TaxID=263140 RepID=UPI0024448A50|nr:uncharacterized protein LOC129572144 [Sitodiplosis mosellana]
MGKDKESGKAFFKRMEKTYPNEFRADDSVLFCKMCDVPVTATQKCQVEQHRKTGKHASSIARKNKTGDNKTQTLLTTVKNDTADNDRDAIEFHKDLAKAFAQANIPFHKITHPAVKELFEKHTKYALPSVFTLRNKYLPQLFDETLTKLKQIAADQFIWVSLDESTDCEQRYVVNFVFGVLGVVKEFGRSYLFASKVLDAVNNSAIAAFFDECINELGVQKCKVLLCLTDAAAYMICAMDALIILYPKMIHFTCAAHGLHRVAEYVRDEHKDVNKLISNVKKMLTKVK